MPEEVGTTETVEATDVQNGSTESTETQETDLAAEVARWKALSRKNEAQAKANAEAAQKLREIEDKDKSEAERLTARLQAAEARAKELELRSVRAEVAAAKGLTAAQAKWLSGSTAEELEAAADELLSAFPKAPPVVGTPDAGPRSSGPKWDDMSVPEMQKTTRR